VENLTLCASAVNNSAAALFVGDFFHPVNGFAVEVRAANRWQME
jgi:hypothetical protein